MLTWFLKFLRQNITESETCQRSQGLGQQRLRLQRAQTHVVFDGLHFCTSLHENSPDLRHIASVRLDGFRGLDSQS